MIVVGTIVVLGFLALLALQGRYTATMVKMRRSQFNESVQRSLDMASHDMERSETYHYLDSVMSVYSDELIAIDTTQVSELPQIVTNPALMGLITYKQRPQDLVKQTETHQPIRFRMTPTSADALAQSAEDYQRALRNAYVYQREVLDQVIYAIMYNASQKSFEERLDTKLLDASLRMSLERNGVSLPFHFRVLSADGREVYRCPDYNDEGSEYSYTQTLFRNDPATQMGQVVVHFPDHDRYVLGVLNMMFPAIVFTVILFVVVIILFVLVVRSRRLAEMKNDFVNNMTHEFKTPLASISLAAQMMTDQSISKTPQMFSNLAGIVQSESNRLRFQVEKVLQVSLYEHKKIRLRATELNADELIDGVIKTFSLKVEKSGGTIETHLGASDPYVMADEMHLTNIVFNLMENAVKYRRPDTDLLNSISTHHVPGRYVVSIEDNGIGLRRDDLKRIFDKFYRVHTGNQHNVKGFGLGLAYVKKMVELHGGSIKAESELGQWTRFTITLPTIKD